MEQTRLDRLLFWAACFFNHHVRRTCPCHKFFWQTWPQHPAQHRAPARAFLGEKPCSNPNCECHD